MLRVIKYSDEFYTIESENELIDSDVYRLVFVLRELNYSFKIIERALVDLLNNGHNILEFNRGGYKTYLDQRYR